MAGLASPLASRCTVVRENCFIAPIIRARAARRAEELLKLNGVYLHLFLGRVPDASQLPGGVNAENSIEIFKQTAFFTSGAGLYTLRVSSTHGRARVLGGSRRALNPPVMKLVAGQWGRVTRCGQKPGPAAATVSPHSFVLDVNLYSG